MEQIEGLLTSTGGSAVDISAESESFNAAGWLLGYGAGMTSVHAAVNCAAMLRALVSGEVHCLLVEVGKLAKLISDESQATSTPMALENVGMAAVLRAIEKAYGKKLLHWQSNGV